MTNVTKFHFAADQISICFQSIAQLFREARQKLRAMRKKIENFR